MYNANISFFALGKCVLSILFRADSGDRGPRSVFQGLQQARTARDYTGTRCDKRYIGSPSITSRGDRHAIYTKTLVAHGHVRLSERGRLIGDYITVNKRTL